MLLLIILFILFLLYGCPLWQEDWQKEKRDFLQSLSRITSLPRTNVGESSPASGHHNQIVSVSRPHLSPMPSTMELAPLADKSVAEKKAAVYAHTVKTMNDARERGLPFKVRAFQGFYSQLEFFLPSLNFYFFCTSLFSRCL